MSSSSLKRINEFVVKERKDAKKGGQSKYCSAVVASQMNLEIEEKYGNIRGKM